MPLSSLLHRAALPGFAAFLVFCGSVAISVPAAFGQNAAPDPMTPSPMTPNPMIPNPMIQSPMGQGFAPLNPLTVDPATREASTVPLNPDFGNLPDAPGMEDTYYSCTACHSTATFSAQRLTDARWEYLWDWMITDQGMADYGDDVRGIILAYLQTHFSSER